jgi:hypothetical protein
MYLFFRISKRSKFVYLNKKLTYSMNRSIVRDSVTRSRTATNGIQLIDQEQVYKTAMESRLVFKKPRLDLSLGRNACFSMCTAALPRRDLSCNDWHTQGHSGPASPRLCCNGWHKQGHSGPASPRPCCNGWHKQGHRGSASPRFCCNGWHKQGYSGPASPRFCCNGWHKQGHSGPASPRLCCYGWHKQGNSGLASPRPLLQWLGTSRGTAALPSRDLCCKAWHKQAGAQRPCLAKTSA